MKHVTKFYVLRKVSTLFTIRILLNVPHILTETVAAIMFLKLIFLICLIRPVFLDCGCNKLGRDEIEEKKLDTTPLSEEKICEKRPISRNEHYRDYYPETEPQIEGMSFITGGEYLIGTDEPYFKADFESPERLVEIKDFYLDKYEVSNKEFNKFVQAKGYKTEAERFGDSFVFKTLLSQEMQDKYKDYRVIGAEWWFKMNNVSWRNPNGPNTDLKGLWNHPVVHISWNDANAYCKWAGKRLPSEAEWEVACRGGKKRKLFPWGDDLMTKNKHRLNIWQGSFPDGNTKDDGYAFTCPVNTFRQNKFDLYNMVGNVWEWVADMWDSSDIGINPRYVKKGGSYLCHKSYCYRYRCAARSQNTADSSAGNLGFRCAKSLLNK